MKVIEEEKREKNVNYVKNMQQIFALIAHFIYVILVLNSYMGKKKI